VEAHLQHLSLPWNPNITPIVMNPIQCYETTRQSAFSSPVQLLNICNSTLASLH
jgi:hypothetical protein